MSKLSDNMRYLRNQLKCSQQKVADDLLITRGRYAKYEEGASEPPVELLIRISRYFHISIDLLVSIDLHKFPLREIIDLPDNRIVLPIKVDKSGDNKIEIIPHKASMGYLQGHSDPEYFETLDTIELPFLAQGKYRAFPATGDSMPPHKEGSYIVGRYINNQQELKEGKSYVFLTRQEGITYKRLVKVEPTALYVEADNPLYAGYLISLNDIFEIWEYASSIATKEFMKDDFNLDHQMVIKMFSELKEEFKNLKVSQK